MFRHFVPQNDKRKFSLMFTIDQAYKKAVKIMVNKYKIADKVAEINSIYSEVHEYCIDYLTDEPVDYSVTTT